MSGMKPTDINCSNLGNIADFDINSPIDPEEHERLQDALYKKVRKEHIENKRMVSKPLLFGVEEHLTYMGHAGQSLISFLHNPNNR